VVVLDEVHILSDERSELSLIECLEKEATIIGEAFPLNKTRPCVAQCSLPTARIGCISSLACRSPSSCSRPLS